MAKWRYKHLKQRGGRGSEGGADHRSAFPAAVANYYVLLVLLLLLLLLVMLFLLLLLEGITLILATVTDVINELLLDKKIKWMTAIAYDPFDLTLDNDFLMT